jgi:Protein of unknown function (DUF3352)
VPSIQDLRYAIRRRARVGRYVAEDAGYAARQSARRASSWAHDRWARVSPGARRLLAAGLGVAVVLAAIALVAIPNLPCAAPGGDECPPEDDAIELVPGDSTAYAHLQTDPGGDQYERAAALAERLPTVTEQIVARLPRPRGVSLDYSRDVAPWLGGEAALAAVPASGRAAELALLLEVGDQAGASRFVERVAGSDARTQSHNGVDVRLYGAGRAVAQVGGFVVVGPGAQVRRVIETEHGGRPLEDTGPASEVLDALPGHRLAELYVSEDGAEELLAPGTALGTFEAFVDARATLGAGAALVATDDGLEIEIHSVLDPERAQSAPGFFAAFPSFRPALAGEASEQALGYLALGDPEESIAGLLAQATAEAPAIAAGFEDVGEQLRKAGNLNLEQEVLPLLSSQAAVVVEPARTREGEPGAPEPELPGAGSGAPDLPEVAPTAGVPFVSLIVDEVDEEQALRALARLQAPIARALDPGRSLQAPAFQEQEIDGVEARRLRISPTVELTYAIVDGRLVISTDPDGVRQVQSGDGDLDGSDRFEHATEGFPDEVSALLYLNLGGLLRLAEAAGLGDDPAYALFSRELRKLKALGVAVERGDEEIDTEIRLTIGE